MNPAVRHPYVVVSATFVIALVLTAIPLPGWLDLLRPEWAALVLIYWCMALPERIGVGIGWIWGLFLDVMRAGLLGENALSFSLIAYVTHHLYQRVRVFPMWQQALSVMVLIIMHQMLILWVKGITGLASHSWTYWLPSLTSMLIWPLIFTLLRFLRRHFKLA